MKTQNFRVLGQENKASLDISIDSVLLNDYSTCSKEAYMNFLTARLQWDSYLPKTHRGNRPYLWEIQLILSRRFTNLQPHPRISLNCITIYFRRDCGIEAMARWRDAYSTIGCMCWEYMMRLVSSVCILVFTLSRFFILALVYKVFPLNMFLFSHSWYPWCQNDQV